MLNARLVLDTLLAVAAVAMPFVHEATPAVFRPSGLVAFISPVVLARSIATGTIARKKRPTAEKKAAILGLTYTVTATAYEAVAAQTDNEPFVTADNSFIKPHYGSHKRWMALSRDLLRQWGGKFDYGDKVRVTGMPNNLDGVYTVHDTMNRRHRHCMDVLVHPSEKLDVFCKGVKIRKLSN